MLLGVQDVRDHLALVITTAPVGSIAAVTDAAENSLGVGLGLTGRVVDHGGHLWKENYSAE